MTSSTRELLEQRGYSLAGDGSFSRPDSLRQVAAVVPAAGKAKRPKVPKPREPSALERKFSEIWKALGGPEMTEEHRFTPSRRWRLDFAHLPTKIAVEIEGITRQGGRHQRIDGFKADCEKYYVAAECGWTVYRLTGNMITRERLEGIMRAILAKR